MNNSLDNFLQTLMKFETTVLNKDSNQINLFNKLIEMFKENHLNNGWISVDDKDNPPPVTEVLACFKFSKFLCLAFYRNGIWYSSDNGEKLTQISHWQPLPNPPKE